MSIGSIESDMLHNITVQENDASNIANGTISKDNVPGTCTCVPVLYNSSLVCF